MEANPSAQWWRMDEGSLWAATQHSQQRLRAEYARQVELVGELWNRTAQGKDDHRTLLTNLAARLTITRAEARELLRHATLLRRDGIREAARAGVLSKQHLNVIDETRQSLIKQGVTPRMVIAFRGPATKLVQTDTEKIKPEDRDGAAKIANIIGGAKRG